MLRTQGFTTGNGLPVYILRLQLQLCFLFNACHVYIWPCFILFIMLKLPPYLNCSKSPTMQPVLNFSKGSFDQKKPVLCSFQGKWFSSWVVLASLWWSTRCSFLFLWYMYVLMVTFLILYMIWHIATMHAWIQLAVALAHVLMYYYGNTASSIRRDLTRAWVSSSSVFGFLEKQNALKFYLRRSKV